MFLQLVADRAAGGLNAVAGYVSEVLSAAGLADPASIPRFTPRGVTLVARWGLLAAAAYWLLYAAMFVGVALARRTFWILRVVAVLWIFLGIVGDPGAPDEVTAARLGLLVTLCAAWSVATGGRRKPNREGERLERLERRVAALEGQRAE